jgi:hypothetical protein
VQSEQDHTIKATIRSACCFYDLLKARSEDQRSGTAVSFLLLPPNMRKDIQILLKIVIIIG